MTVGRGEEVDHLPANGRAVTFLACQPAKVAAAVAAKSGSRTLRSGETPASGGGTGSCGAGDDHSASGGSEAVLGARLTAGR